MNSVSSVEDLSNLSSSVSISSPREETHLFFEKPLLNYQSCGRKQKLADFLCIISAALSQLLFIISNSIKMLIQFIKVYKQQCLATTKFLPEISKSCI